MTLIESRDTRIRDITGSRGSWIATVTYADRRTERLSCLHDYFWDTRLNTYNDPLNPGLIQTRKFQEYAQLIRDTSRIIMTRDKVNPEKFRGEGFFSRLPKPDGYVDVFTVHDFVVDEAGMRCRFGNTRAGWMF